MPSTPILAVAAVVVAVFLLAALYFKNYIKVPPNMVAVFTGRGEIKIVRGGGKFKIPGIERVDFMSIEPFNIEVTITGALSSEGVPVSVNGVALVRFGSDDQTIRTAVERFLTADRAKVAEQTREIIAGNLRGIIANMTVEALNASREQLSKSALEEAEGSFERIGMELEVLTIQNISDDRGYLEALGRRRIAEVVRDAEIGEAEAKRDSQIKSADAKRQGETAQAQADAEIAEANRDRDLKIAAISGEVAAQQAAADQAGPLAKARSEKDVGIAEEEARAAREQAAIAVETQRVAKAKQTAQADIVVPAAAEREAAALRAEAQKVSLVKTAEGESEKQRLLAAGRQAELMAEAAGEQARLEAEAAGRQELAEALNAYSDAAMRLQVLPDIIAAMPKMAEAIAAQIGQIDRYVVIDGSGTESGDGNGNTSAVERMMTLVPLALATTLETVRATTGVDFAAMAAEMGSNGHRNGHEEAPTEAALETFV